MYERRAIARLTKGACVAVLGPSGAGKSSMIAWTCYQLPASHFALQIPITGVEDPGSVGEIARLALSIALDEVMLDATTQEALEQSRATSQSTVRTPTRLASAKLGGGAIPAEVSLNVSSLREEFIQNRLPGDHLITIPLLKDHARAAVAAILVKRFERVVHDTPLAAILDGTALDALAEFYSHSGGDLRRVLAAAHEAAEHAAADQANQIGASHARFGIAQWQ